MVAKSYSVGFMGLDTFPVEVETDLSSGLPAFDIVGLPDTAIKESRDRVRSAIKNCGFKFPVSRITINLAPADKRKEGPIYDLAILISTLKASGQLEAFTDDSVFLGELSLSGEIRPVRGILPMALQAQQDGFKKIFVPSENACEAAIVKELEVYPADNLLKLVAHLTQEKLLTRASFVHNSTKFSDITLDFQDVRGQSEVKRALEIVASGGHNILLVGPPGSGKSMLAKRMPSIMPNMTFKESIETTKIYSIAGILDKGISLIELRPFRSPHHTVSPAGLAGGGTIPRPGEVSLAHNGILFLDELPEFSRTTMEILRQPIEDGFVTISRVNGTVAYPSKITLIAAMNPCPCGYFGHLSRSCTCSGKTIDRYLNKVSGPLLDRFDLHVEVPSVDFDSLSSTQKSESSSDIKARVDAARYIQTNRFENTKVHSNAMIPQSDLQKHCNATVPAMSILKQAFEQFGISARAYARVLRIARTIADLEQAEQIESYHMAEAVQYRSLDRKYWRRELSQL